MYFRDLTPYEYRKGQPSALNVGWLDSAHPFARGIVPDGFVARLRKLALHPVNQMRGFHVCQFCDFGRAPAAQDQAAVNAYFERLKAAEVVSAAEMRVVGRDGSAYAAPILICHYVQVHGYQPPDVFVEAVMELE